MGFWGSPYLCKKCGEIPQKSSSIIHRLCLVLRVNARLMVQWMVGRTKMPVTVTAALSCIRRSKLVLGMLLAAGLVNPCLGEEESHHPPLLDSSLRPLDLGFKHHWAAPYKPTPCAQPCFPFESSVSAQGSPDQPLSYEQDFRLNLGESGPLSFRLSGSRLKMEVEF